MTVGIHVYHPPSGGEGLGARNESSAGLGWTGVVPEKVSTGDVVEKRTDAGALGRTASFIPTVICVSRRLIPSLSTVCHMAPCLSSLFTLHTHWLQLSPVSELISVRSYPRPRPQRGRAGSGGHGCRLPSGGGARGVDCRSVSF